MDKGLEALKDIKIDLLSPAQLIKDISNAVSADDPREEAFYGRNARRERAWEAARIRWNGSDGISDGADLEPPEKAYGVLFEPTWLRVCHLHLCLSLGSVPTVTAKHLPDLTSRRTSVAAPLGPCARPTHATLVQNIYTTFLQFSSCNRSV
ncbi:hypothetical protein Z517_09219 [Fonsecaea pedrosoi CBS 271.37]|uniref:Uncharacterized protein n=1 Tax=Fonsecaea pedrosoi CBS 271.37 TaxID=1442368 RepID=A0A0D2GDK3_9EURO|nr:uncharacterized protein Z517_09219 [Fonsecaea pedrosoi CBS 271.37]KIW76775.1 hypothetical protein Z517_09219 [Fonsecaea pedrosoi CBS 271.37]